MSFADGQRIAHEFLDDVLRVYHNQKPCTSFLYHDVRYHQALESGMPEQWGLLFAIMTRFDVNAEKCRYASFVTVGVPELPYVYA